MFLFFIKYLNAMLYIMFYTNLTFVIKQQVGDVNSNSMSKGDVIRYIDEESGESDGRSFTPSPSRQRSHFYCHSRARSKSVGHLHNLESSQMGQTTHHLHQLTSIEAFLAFRRSLSLKDCKKVCIKPNATFYLK